MPRDYAQRSTPPRRHTRRPKGRTGGNVPGWVWLIAGLSFGLAVAAFVYIRRPMTPPPEAAASEDVAAVEAAEAHEKPRNSTRNRNAKPPALPLPPKEKDRFTFYEILKNQEVVLPAEAAKSSQPPRPPPPAPGEQPPATGSSYIIQVASYRAQTEAEKQKANLALLGIESRIESVTIDGKDTFYRVRIGPERDWGRVQATMARLEQNRIQALLVKLQ